MSIIYCPACSCPNDIEIGEDAICEECDGWLDPSCYEDYYDDEEEE